MPVARRPIALLALLVLVALPFAGCGAMEGIVEDYIDDANPPPPPPPPPPGDGTTGMSAAEEAWAMDLLARVNVERANVGAPALQWHSGAAGVAYAHCADMDARNFFDHVNPDGKSPGDRLRDAGILWSTYGENIAWGQDDPASVMAAWMNSPGHRANILNASFTHLGVGVSLAPGGPWWTQLFLVPLSQ